jgi:hypothetical protein
MGEDQVLGGSCRNMMPSNVIRPGAWARASIPARGSKYANETEANLIKDLFKQYGCHHCGTRHGQSIADHMPPNAILKKSQARKFQRLLCNLNQLFVKKQPIMQRLFPQCSSCMKLQSTALRHGKSTFVFHFQQGIPQVGSFYSGITSVNFVFRFINLQDKFGFGNRISISEFHPYIVS